MLAAEAAVATALEHQERAERQYEVNEHFSHTARDTVNAQNSLIEELKNELSAVNKRHDELLSWKRRKLELD